MDADLEIDGSEGSKFRQIKALARSFQQLSSATATTYPLSPIVYPRVPLSPLEYPRVPWGAVELSSLQCPMVSTVEYPEPILEPPVP